MEIATARSHNPKRKRDTTSPPPPFSNGETAADEIDLSLLDAIEKSQSLSKSQPIETLDLKTLKKLILSFERKYKENIESRLKYPDHPEKFADSEIDLHNELQKLKILSSAPELYPDLITLNSIPSILSLLSHENTDIAIDVIQLLQDLTDEDVVEMSNENEEESMKVLVNTLIENNVLELLVQNLQRLSDSDDQDEMAAVYNTLATVENMIEVEPKVAEMICEKTRNSEANQKKLGQMNGVDVVLQAVAMYKSKDPKSGDEEEMVENLFDCLCCLLMPLENKERFVKAEGVELMIIIMKQKKLAYGSAIRALDFAMTNYPPACERFVDVLGLKTAFAAFMVFVAFRASKSKPWKLMKTYMEIIYLFKKSSLHGNPASSPNIPMSKKNKKERYQEELEERVVSLIASLFGGILRGSRRERVLSKFVESECEKIDRLMELYIRYSDRVKEETKRMDELELDDLEMDEDERYNRKLESGLYTLQSIAIILGHLWCSEHPRMRARIELLLRQQKLTKNDVKDILLEYHDNIGDLDGPEEKERVQARVLKFISAFELS
ncbi:BETA-CATENIN-LIKE PROTEIN 1 [Salix purpurea]|uniref:BETA-CATENIN-LIKE PROTEIN 1 n=2 Tax=Salix TaxID=40685 RepID=A0A9Q0WGB2_SALPP|nr:BETA-CATENIN-LIKE PROTEIN 1 [Salix purpurea]